MIKTHKLETDGGLTVTVDNGDGTGASWSMTTAQATKHRRDPAFEAALPADVKTAIDQLPKP